MNGRPLVIPLQMSPNWAAQARRTAEARLQTSGAAIARSSRLLADHHLHEIRGLVSLAVPRRRRNS
jgi:hypothetical protein